MFAHILIFWLVRFAHCLPIFELSAKGNACEMACTTPENFASAFGKALQCLSELVVAGELLEPRQIKHAIIILCYPEEIC